MLMARKEIVIQLQRQVERLIADHERVSAECRELVAERDMLLRDKRRLEERCRELDARIKSVELGEALSGVSGGNVEKARALINALLREVDRCIAAVKHDQEREEK